MNHKPNHQKEEMLESTKPRKEFSMSLALIQNFWGNGAEEFTKMQTPTKVQPPEILTKRLWLGPRPFLFTRSSGGAGGLWTTF